MIRIKLEGETWQDVQNQAREIGGCAIPFEEIEAENVAAIAADVVDNPVMPPPVGPVDKGDGLTEFRPIIDKVAELYGEGSEIHHHAVAAANQPAPPTIPAIDALPPAPPPPAATAAPDVDARGIPWDARIHAGNKATTKDGSWKRRRGTDLAEVQRIEAELAGTPAPPPPPGPLTEPEPYTFEQLMREAGKKQIGIKQLNEICDEMTSGQIGQIALIRDKPAWIQAVYGRVIAL